MSTTMRFTPPLTVEPADPAGATTRLLDRAPGRSASAGGPTPLVWVGAASGPWQRVRETALTAGAGLGLLCVAVTAVVMVAGLTPLVVRSGSMEPDMAVGSLAIARPVPAADVTPGEVVSVVLPDGTRVTHRVVDVESMSAGTSRLTLQGDANAAPDAEPVVVTEVDRVIVSIPVLGRAVEQLGRPLWTFVAGLLSGTALLWAFGPATVSRIGAWMPEARTVEAVRR